MLFEDPQKYDIYLNTNKKNQNQTIVCVSTKVTPVAKVTPSYVYGITEYIHSGTF